MKPKAIGQFGARLKQELEKYGIDVGKPIAMNSREREIMRECSRRILEDDKVIPIYKKQLWREVNYLKYLENESHK
jgi:hypothetical protein